MPQSSQKTKEIQHSIKVQDFLKMLQLVEKLYNSPLGTNPGIISFIKKLRTILAPYAKLKENEFSDLLKNSLRTYKAKKAKIEKRGAIDLDVENITFEELRTLFSKKILTKEQLLLVGEKRFGISKGAHRKLKKEQLQDLIESAMENIETLNIIKTRASE